MIAVIDRTPSTFDEFIVVMPFDKGINPILFPRNLSLKSPMTQVMSQTLLFWMKLRSQMNPDGSENRSLR